MSLRAKLIIAFFLLAVVPLAGVTAYSYISSIAALRRATESESRALAEDIGRRMETVAADLSQRIEKLGGDVFLTIMPVAAQPDGAKMGEASPDVEGKFAREMGDAVQWVESFEFVPEAHAAPPHPQPPIRAAAAPSVPEAPAPESGVVARRKYTIVLEKEKVRKAVAEAKKHALDAARAAREAKDSGPAAVATAAGTASSDHIGFGKWQFGCNVEKDGVAVGHLQAKVKGEDLLMRVLSLTRGDQGEIPFATDADGCVFTPKPADMAVLTSLGVGGGEHKPSANENSNWVVVSREDTATGLTFGIARPVGDSLREIRGASLRSFGYGSGMVLVAMLGIVPLSRRMTRDLGVLSEGASRLAAGDLGTRVRVRSSDEIGRLAHTFNHMAQELQSQQSRLLERERLKKELEMCRRFQEELLPRRPLTAPFAEVQGVSIPAREVGGDFFNYFSLPDGRIAVLIGDVSGKGVPAALLMANVQATLRARLPIESDLRTLAICLDLEIASSTAPETYLTLFMGVLDGEKHTLRFVNAGHNSQFLLRTEGLVEELHSTGRPLGLLPGGGYEERSVSLAAGDTLFLFTDGLLDTENPAGVAFGVGGLREVLRREYRHDSEAILARVEEAVRAHRGAAEPADDATMLVMRVAGETTH